MRRTVLPIAAILLTAACAGSADDTSSTTSSPSVATSRAQPSRTSSTPQVAESKASPTKSCSPTRDVIVWTKAAGLPDSAQVLGNYFLMTCESTFKWLERTSPTEAEDCTEAAWASDNPGYNADAVPAARLKKVQMSVGPAC